MQQAGARLVGRCKGVEEILPRGKIWGLGGPASRDRENSDYDVEFLTERRAEPCGRTSAMLSRTSTISTRSPRIDEALLRGRSHSVQNWTEWPGRVACITEVSDEREYSFLAFGGWSHARSGLRRPIQRQETKGWRPGSAAR